MKHHLTVHFWTGLILTLLTAGCGADRAEKTARSASNRDEGEAKHPIITLVSDPYPPYVMEGPEGAQGYITDAALLIFRKAGYEAVYKNVPYERALVGMENTQFSGLLAVSPGRKNYTYPRGNLGFFENKFFVRKETDWAWTGPASLEGLVLGAVKGYGFDDGGVIDTYIESYAEDLTKVDLVYGIRPMEQNLRKLVQGRVDLLFDDSLALWYTAGELGLTDQIKAAPGYTDKTSEPILVGFNLNHPQARHYAEIMTRGIQEIRRTGELAEILKRYQLQDHIK